MRVRRDELIELVDSALAVDDPGADRGQIVAGVAAAARLVAWCEAQQIAGADALAELGLPAEVVVAQATRCNRRDAERVVQRSITAQAAPAFADALTSGRVSGGHLDQLSHSIRRLEPAHRATLLADAQRLVTVAAASTPEEFGRSLRAEERRLTADDGTARLHQQMASVRLHRRVDSDGMNIFTLALDPLTGLTLHNKIAAATETLFHDATPAHCPSDPIEKQAFLRAHALMQIIDRQGIRLGRPEITVVVDTTAIAADGAPTIDWGLPVEIPHSVLRDLFRTADTHTVVTRNGAILHAPGSLDLGRSTRLANHAQRRALRAIYPTCAHPHCATRYDHCHIHHVKWWRNHGETNLSNLLPLCTKHHALVHQPGWQLTLAPDRQLTITHPNGTTQTTGPPSRRAA